MSGHSHNHGHSHGGRACNHAHGQSNQQLQLSQPPPQQVQKPMDVSEMTPVQLTQRGYLQALQERVENKTFDVNSADGEGITCLHWAAINNRTAIIKYLLDQGAEVDPIGGELQSPPLHWAIRYNHLQTVVMLLQHGADPTISDGQGLNALHVAAQLGYANVCAYLVARGVHVDCPEKDGRTPLMCAAIKAQTPEVTRILLTLKASINLQDNFGNTALHYAASFMNVHAARILIHSGAEREIKNKQDMTPMDVAYFQSEMEKREGKPSPRIAQIRQLMPKGADGSEEINRWRRDPFRRYMILLLPLLGLSCLGYSLCLISSGNYLIGAGLFILILWQWMAAAKFFSFGYRFGQNPTGMALYWGTKLMFTYTFIQYYVPLINQGYLAPGWLHILTWLSLIFVTYYFFKANRSNPGYIPRSSGTINATIIDLAEKNMLDPNQFCMTCILRKPLRSKHCSSCDRCVAKFDHHCPFIDNCVGVGNHHYFITYLVFFVMVNVSYLFLTIQYLRHVSEDVEGFGSSVWFCMVNATWVTFTLPQCMLHLSWVTMLLLTQLKQVMFDGLTTNEAINRWRYEYLKANPRPAWHLGPIGNLIDLYYPKVDWYNTFMSLSDSAKAHQQV